MRVSVSIEVNRPTLGRHRRRRVLAAALVAALVVPAAAWANHQFTDVPTSDTFHNTIGQAKDAGLTTGCTATTFCPDDPVSRGQMTAFLNRGLGRVTADYITGNTNSSTPATMGSLTIRASNASGGNQYVMLLASVNVKTNGAGCPCEIFAGLYEGDGTPLGVDTFIDMAAIPGGQFFTDESATLLGIAIVPTGTNQTFIVRVSRSTGTANVEVGGRFQAFTLPFDGNGEAPHN